MTRFGYVMIAYFGSMATVVTAFLTPTPRLIWNASASVPIGLYAVRPGGDVTPGDLVAVAPPDGLAAYMAQRHYLPRGVPLLKHVAAVAGQRVCRNDLHILVDGRPVGEARERDRIGRPLPVWQGCHRLGRGEVFLMNQDISDSFDGRYFGPLPLSRITGRLSPIWTEHGLPSRRKPGAKASRASDLGAKYDVK
jgi:conjugative transfer signal peptidase TraF